jgi:hypothetical protein
MNKPQDTEAVETVQTTNVPAVDLTRIVRHLWVQYAYEDTLNAPIIQTADTEEEAREENETVMSGCCWYRYDIAHGEGDGNLINEDGPHSLPNETSAATGRERNAHE